MITIGFSSPHTVISAFRILIALLLPSATGLSAVQTPAESADIAFFERDIRPLLAEHCLECHSVESGKRKGGLLLDSREGIAQGGDSGPALLPGNPEERGIVSATRWNNADLRMPPKKPLDASKAELLAEWIRRGAPDPREANARPRGHSGMSIEEGRA